MQLRENKYFNIEGNEDEHFRIYHVRMQLLDTGWSQISGFKGVYNINDSTAIPPIMALFLDTPGVVWVRVMNYQIEVRKSPMFTWEEIDKTLISALLGIITALEEPADMSDVLDEVRNEEPHETDRDSNLPVRIDDGADIQRDFRLLPGNNRAASGVDDSDCTPA